MVRSRPLQLDFPQLGCRWRARRRDLHADRVSSATDVLARIADHPTNRIRINELLPRSWTAECRLQDA
jgi:hypothetical protein